MALHNYFVYFLVYLAWEYNIWYGDTVIYGMGIYGIGRPHILGGTKFSRGAPNLLENLVRGY